MMQTMARMKMKKYEPYIPITERASTGLGIVRRLHLCSGITVLTSQYDT
jgi:hypothetical protein